MGKDYSQSRTNKMKAILDLIFETIILIMYAKQD